MQFPRAVRSCGSVDHDNHRLFSSLRIPHGINLELAGIENQGEIGDVLEEKGVVDGEDLSAVVMKYKNNIQCFDGCKFQVVPQFHQIPREHWIGGKGEEMDLGIKKIVNGGYTSLKGIHSFSERVRRTEMNQLFAEMSSLLPTSAVKRSKACIVSEIVDYIESLQHQLAIHSTNNAGPKFSVSNGRTTSLLGNESTPEEEFPLSDYGGSYGLLPTTNKNCIDDNLSMVCNGKEIFITVKSVRKADVLTSLIYAVESHNIQVINGFASTTDTVAFHCLHAKVGDMLAPERKETLFRNLKKLVKSGFKISLKTEGRTSKGL